jgi:hypothetical protein
MSSSTPMHAPISLTRLQGGALLQPPQTPKNNDDLKVDRYRAFQKILFVTFSPDGL